MTLLSRHRKIEEIQRRRMHIKISPDCGMSERRPLGWSRRDVMKVAQYFSAGLGFENVRPVSVGTIDRMVIWPLTQPSGRQAKPNPKPARRAGTFYRPYRDGTVNGRFIPSTKVLSYFRCVLPGRSAHATDQDLSLVTSVRLAPIRGQGTSVAIHLDT